MEVSPSLEERAGGGVSVAGGGVPPLSLVPPLPDVVPELPLELFAGVNQGRASNRHRSDQK